jgi:hypothetical protein
VVTNLAGTLAAGDNFQLFNANATSGAFTALNLPPLSSGLGWSLNSASGVLGVVQTTPTNLVWSVNGTNLTLSWPAGYTGWRLQGQTNGLATGLSTNWFDVTGSPATNNVSLSVDVNNSSVFYRLIYP